MKCARCNDTGIWVTGNNDLPCNLCAKGSKEVRYREALVSLRKYLYENGQKADPFFMLKTLNEALSES
jgi:hypothetical protein